MHFQHRQNRLLARPNMSYTTNKILVDPEDEEKKAIHIPGPCSGMILAPGLEEE